MNDLLMDSSESEKNITILWTNFDAAEPTGTPEWVKRVLLFIFVGVICGGLYYCLCKRRPRDSSNQPHERTNIVGNSGNQTSPRRRFFILREIQIYLRQNPQNDPMPMPSMVPTAPPEHPPPPADDAKPPSYEQVTQVMGDKNG
ncbi:uncharacterized protein LOC132258453 [Phlebotomus argentipes]|uniref:uncharacterized protein LOC132258453 n=1 Tax=Phlebotomus argentipes TaxID=94469 RepID=UPI0028929D29|nr:uncharacterized protein LOC132258453 [Phlebotomus argentipes]